MTTSILPRVNMSIIGASQEVLNTPQKVLFVGQKTSAGTAPTGSLVENILVNAENELFGARSQLAGMIRSARAQNPITRFDAIVLADHGSGVSATGAVVFSGTATASGELKIAIGSKNDFEFSVPVTVGDTATAIGAALVALLTADEYVPVTAINTSGSVAITAANDGTLGNFIGLGVTGSVAGVTVALTAMSSGATDPALTGVFDVIADKRYQGIVWPYFAAVSEVESFLDGRFNVDNRVLDGVAFTGAIDTFANHLTRLNALNSKALVEFCDEWTNETAYKAPALFELPQVVAAQFAAVRALRLTDGASIGGFVIATNGPLDAIGGAALASKPYFNTPFPDLPVIKTGRGFTDLEVLQLKDAGGSVIGNNSAGNGVIAGEIVTTYKTDSAGNPDISFKYLNYVDTSSGSREYCVNNARVRFAQSRLTQGDVVSGRDQVNELIVRAFMEKMFVDLSGPKYVLWQGGPQALKYFKSNLHVTLDMSLGKVTIIFKAPLQTQLRDIDSVMQISFSIFS